jgi:outer membrane protein OmpA-like peptidoglycan-associated protein
MKSKKTRCLAVVTALLGLIVLSCDRGNNQVDALVIIVGRHANANAFCSTHYTPTIEAHIKNTVYGGYIGVISSEGIPRVLERFNDFNANEPNARRRERQKNNDTEFVLDFLKNENRTMATSPENDLLKAIQEANMLLSVFEEQAKGDKKQIGKKTVIIMNTGVVTIGALDFSARGIDRFDFSVSNDKIVEFASGVANALSVNRQMPNLSGVDVVFMGLGDVAYPQMELSAHVRNGLNVLWRTILDRAGAESVTISPYTSTRKPNVPKSRGGEFPDVRPIEFLENTGWQVSSEQVHFNLGQWIYANPEEAERNLRRFADVIRRHIDGKPNVKIYVVGSESKDQDREYTTVLSERRASTVMETLVKFGVPRNRMEAFGLAVYLPRREDDRPGNVFCEVIGARNQKVVLIPDNIEDVEFLQEIRAIRNRLYRRG